MNTYRITNSPQDLAQNARLLAWFEGLEKELESSNQRALVMLEGSSGLIDLESCRDDGKKSLLLSDNPSLAHAVRFKKVENLLGSEADCVVYDLCSGLNIDVLCMAVGLVRAGGILLLLAPEEASLANDPFGQWQGRYASEPVFLHYLMQQWAGCEVFFRFDVAQDYPQIRPLPQSPMPDFSDGLTSDQQQLLQSLRLWYTEKNRPLFLLTADRGRGKSTLLGIYANQLARSAPVVVSAASRSQAAVLMNQLDAQTRVSFMAPDDIIRRQLPIQTLIIDEAAMLPMGQLKACIELAHKTILATTTAGYEGTGQGFMLKFIASLNQQEFTHMQLQQAVRWGQLDLLEQTFNESLMLASASTQQMPHNADIRIELISKMQLVNDLELLKAVYQLLVSAHYRTHPADLRQLMEDENQLLLIARAGRAVYGVLLLNQEGGLDAELSLEIFMGRRRPQGHLLAQMLTAQAGIAHFSHYRGYRVQRIAVAQSMRRRGLGRQLIEQAKQLMRSNRLDYLGSSFSLDQANAAFWSACGFQLQHIASGKGKSSGRQTLVVLHSEQAAVLSDMKVLQQKIQHDLMLWLSSYCRDMYWQDVTVILSLLVIDHSMNQQDLNEVKSFAIGYRGMDYTLPALQRFLMFHAKTLLQLNHSQQRVLIEKIMLNRDWDAVLNHTDFAGRKPLLQEIRNLFRQLYEQNDET